MAIPISLTPRTHETHDEIAEQLETARISHAKAVLAAYELLQEMHDSGAIDLCRGILGASNTLAIKIATASASPEAINAVRNLISITRILGNLDPEVLHHLADELAARAQKKSAPPKAFALMKMLVSAETRRVASGGIAFVQAFGRALAASQRPRVSQSPPGGMIAAHAVDAAAGGR